MASNGAGDLYVAYSNAGSYVNKMSILGIVLQTITVDSDVNNDVISSVAVDSVGTIYVGYVHNLDRHVAQYTSTGQLVTWFLDNEWTGSGSLAVSTDLSQCLRQSWPACHQ